MQASNTESESKMRLVIVESPCRAETRKEFERNIRYALAALRDSIVRGESPYASHILLPGALDDDDLVERELGIMCGYAWWPAASAVCFYTDLGWSPGMIAARHRAKFKSIKIEERSIENYRYAKLES